MGSRVKSAHQVVACGQADEENQLTEQQGDIDVESNAHTIPLMIADQMKRITNDYASCFPYHQKVV